MNIDNDFDVCLFQNSQVVMDNKHICLAKSFVNAKSYDSCDHHFSHASGSFYQSHFDKALVFSYDGGGSDGFFNVYLADRLKGVEELERFNVNLGFAYMVFGQFFGDIKKEPCLSHGNLAYSGKIMGLEGYGKVNDDWLPAFESFYNCNMHNNFNHTESENFWMNKIKALTEATNIEFDADDRFTGQLEYDIAATSQRAFENVFLRYVEPYIEKYSDFPIILTGGCALNILLNTRVKELFNRPMYVAPNSSDSGLSAGMLLSYLKPKEPIDLTYAGIPLLDSGTFFERASEEEVSKVDLRVISKALSEGSIIGVARGRSEHGPRALGNRSIICDTSLEGMKDILNERVKHRIGFRPFAPIVRLEDVAEYFNFFDGESRHMSFSAKVKEEWRDKLKSITHVDGTARIQTVTRKQNPFMYDLLTEFKRVSGHGVLLNTSFNVNGKPILSSVSDAFNVFREGGLDV